MRSVRLPSGFINGIVIVLACAALTACGGASGERKRSHTATNQGQGGERDAEDIKPLPVGAVHPNRVGSRSYPEEYYEPTIIPPKGAAENDRQ